MTHLTSLSASEILSLWKLNRLYEPPRIDCSITRIDSVDTDSIVDFAIRRWYLEMLDSLPAEALPIVDVTSELALSRTPSGAGLVSLPDSVYRLSAIRLNSWHAPATIATAGSRLARAQSSPYSRAGASAPVAVHYGRFIHLFTPAHGTDSIASASAILYPTQESYLFTPRMLSLICPDYNLS